MENIAPDLVPHEDQEDSVIWTLSTAGTYFTKSAWEALRSKAPDVGWWPMVWYKKHVPRWSFILWLAILGRLSTKDRLHKWGIINDSFCVLCCGGVESHSHLFFDCPFSSSIWLRVRTCCGLQAHAWDLNSEVQWGSLHGKDSSMRVTLFKLCLAASVYYLWKVRNGRIFLQVGHESTGVEKLILDEVKSCAGSWKHELKTLDNLRVCSEWRISDSIFL
ncbi:hypothetical protein RHMOL_Rhmol12G0140600 [Rhododendron molle]|uniref:Uncharacterized protein n=1 Tax=Rhododendron molle TaxID=49168 RepID=A0ACC0LJG1_RHOML|nr:hypothetical protein RHMOL_Rhmol12G0140600 [Rhododendron molle]